jgi:hypothetical protein
VIQRLAKALVLEKRQRFDQFVDCAVSEVERTHLSTIPRP